MPQPLSTPAMNIPGRSKPPEDLARVVADNIPSFEPSSCGSLDGRIETQDPDRPHSITSSPSSQCLPFTPPTTVPLSLTDLSAGTADSPKADQYYGESAGGSLSESLAQTGRAFDRYNHQTPSVSAIRTTGLTSTASSPPPSFVSKSAVVIRPENPELDAVLTANVSPANRLRRQNSNISRRSTSTVCHFTVIGSMSPPQVESTPVLGRFFQADGGVKDSSNTRSATKISPPHDNSTSSRGVSKTSPFGGLNPQMLIHKARKSFGRRHTLWTSNSSFIVPSNSPHRTQDINLVEEDEHELGKDPVASNSLNSLKSDNSTPTSSFTQLTDRLKPFRNPIRAFTALTLFPGGNSPGNSTNEGSASGPDANDAKVAVEHVSGTYILPVERQCDSPPSSPRAESPEPKASVVCETTDDLRAKNIRRGTSISGHMSAQEIVSLLIAHDCQDVTRNIDIRKFNDHPIFHGGFSDIFRGQLLNGEDVAVKALRVSVESLAENPSHLRQAARELHTWSKCNHPNVMPLLGLTEFRGRIGMVSPWMWNGNLPCYLEKAKEVDRHHLSLQICEGLSYLHSIGIVHGDLKGANVLISEKGVPVLTDFGNAILRDQTLKFTQARSTNGLTARWSAPELLKGIRHTEASDVYALGMTVYEVMTGRLPYYNLAAEAIIYLVVFEKRLPDRPENLPVGHDYADGLWELLTRCWLFEPVVRPSAMEVAQIMTELIKS